MPGDRDIGSAGEDVGAWRQLLSSVIAEVFMLKCDNEIVIFLIIWPHFAHYVLSIKVQQCVEEK